MQKAKICEKQAVISIHSEQLGPCDGEETGDGQQDQDGDVDCRVAW
jgi:hypothetical protein